MRQTGQERSPGPTGNSAKKLSKGGAKYKPLKKVIRKGNKSQL